MKQQSLRGLIYIYLFESNTSLLLLSVQLSIQTTLLFTEQKILTHDENMQGKHYYYYFVSVIFLKEEVVWGE